MSLITGLLYAALAVYLGGWYLGHWHGNFSLLLFILTVVTLAYWLAEKFKFRPDREAAAMHLVEQDHGALARDQVEARLLQRLAVEQQALMDGVGAEDPEVRMQAVKRTGEVMGREGRVRRHGQA